MINTLFPNVDWPKMWEAALETLYMTAVSTILTAIFGLALGLLLFLTSPHQAWANKLANWLTGAFVNIFRSIPFIILIILLIPLRNYFLIQFVVRMRHFQRLSLELLRSMHVWC